MIVHFCKLGARRYAVYVEREKAPAMLMEPAPGFDEFLLHDLLHFVAEAEWGIDGAVFGQLAAGGDAGTFWPLEKRLIATSMRRRKRTRTRHRGGRRSEMLAAALEAAWNARSGRAPLPPDWDQRLAAARVERERFDRIVASLDDLAKQWHQLGRGESLTHQRPHARRPATARVSHNR